MPKGPLTQLLKIQELELVLHESAIVHGAGAVDDKNLKRKIADLRKKVPQAFLNHYDSVKRNGMGIAREIGGRCRACQVVMPNGDLNNIRSGRIQAICPSCNIYIYIESFGQER